jgi:DNA-binding transcriptional ArsR family regulator
MDGETEGTPGGEDRAPQPDPSTIKLSDPKAMRALAHPLRLKLLAELRVRGPQSVGMLCEIVDEAPGSVSYHIGKLAQFGFVEEAPELARDRRERWWRASHHHTQTSASEDLDDPERRLASSELRRTWARRLNETYEAYLEQEPTLDPDWVKASTTGDEFLHLTLDQMRELKAEVNDLVLRWRAKGADVPQEGTETAILTYQLFRRPR